MTYPDPNRGPREADYSAWWWIAGIIVVIVIVWIIWAAAARGPYPQQQAVPAREQQRPAPAAPNAPATPYR
jgi:hypothetical protein